MNDIFHQMKLKNKIKMFFHDRGFLFNLIKCHFELKIVKTNSFTYSYHNQTS